MANCTEYQQQAISLTKACIRSMTIIFWTVLSLETLVIIVANAMLCCLFFSSRKLRTKQNYFVLSLSISDLLVGLTVPPCEYCAHTKAQYCSYFCGSVISFNMFASLINLVLIAFDRFMSINQPFKYQTFLTRSRAIVIIMAGWILTFALTLLPFSWIFSKSIDIDVNLYFTLAMFTCVIVIGVMLCYAYYKIVRLVKVKLSGERASNPAGIRVCILVAISFFICWIPTCVVEVMLQYKVPVSRAAPFISYSILLLNPCMDPIMYAYYRRDFRKELLNVITTKKYNIRNQNSKLLDVA